jgi:hypothetical protein
MRGDIAIQMALTFVLNVEGEDVAGEVFPSRATCNTGIAVLEDMTDTVLKVRNTVFV